MVEVKFIQRIAEEVDATPTQVTRTLELLNGGATLPFIARYRKDVTGNLNEVKIETIAARNAYFVGLTDRRRAVLEAIGKLGKLTDELRESIENCYDKTTLEDLYLPFKKARQTKASVARAKGLLPLAEHILAQVDGDPGLDAFASTFVRTEKHIATVEEAFEGARHILAEMIALDISVRAALRERMLKEGRITTTPTKNTEGKKTKFESYYAFSEPAAKIPSHRFLAVLRGVREGVLRMELTVDDQAIVAGLLARYVKQPGSVFEPHLQACIQDAYDRLLKPSIENEVMALAHDRADEEAIHVFRENAHNLLLFPPAGALSIIGLDPGLRTGCKLAVVDKTGAFVESATIFPTPPQNDTEGAEKTLVDLMRSHGIHAVAIGNGTGAREAAAFVKEVLAKNSENGVFSVLVSEAGASVYSASKLGREEFPDLDVTVRGAISIARRLQDPLAELVKIDPRHIGVGQYQHDVNQKRLRDGLERTVVSCVNKVGADLNTASESLLRYVSGIQSSTASAIVAYRQDKGGFQSRQQLMDVTGIGPRVFEQCAGFLRIRNAQNPLDATGIHPEAYPIIEKIAETLGISVVQLTQESERLREIDLAPFGTSLVGALALEDIRAEFLKPVRDPRTEFKVPKFLDGVSSVQDLNDGMEMEGVVTNVTDFGAFVDIGVHQDGLVHLSELANRFIQDPREVVKVGEIVKVKVLKVDKALPRISLSIKALLPPRERPARPRPPHRPHPTGEQTSPPPTDGAPRPEGDGTPPADRPRDRRPRPDRHDQPAERPQRPAARADRPERPPRPQQEQRRDGDQRPRDGRPPERRDGARRDGHSDKRGPRPGNRDRKPMPFQKLPESNEQLNTQLADQLSALRDKFRS